MTRWQFRSGKPCGHKLFYCAWCAEVRGTNRAGCQTKGCGNNQFKSGNDACMDCGRPHEMMALPVGSVVDDPAPAAEPVVHEGKRGKQLNIEKMFAAALGVVALIIAGSFVVNLARRMAAEPRDTRVRVYDDVREISSANSARALQVSDASVCGCFSEGRAHARAPEATPLSQDFATGLKYCRAVLGPIGGDAWTAGWMSVTTGRGSCGKFLSDYGR